MIELRHLSKNYRTPGGTVAALQDLSLTVASGEIFGVIGRSGAGKSTLIRCINLLERPSSGQVLVEGQDLVTLKLADLNAARRRIGMIFQHFNLLSSRTVAENVALPLEIAGLDRAEIARRVGPLLELVGLASKADQYPAKLSGGQKQRVGIARALASKPGILLCDEATSALDPETTRTILALLRDIRAQLGLTIVLITHEMSVIKQVADRVAVLEAGQIVESGSVFDVFTRPRHATTRSFVSELVGHDLPPGLFDRPDGAQALARGRILRILFTGPSATRPIVSEVSRRFSLDLNILYGRIDEIQARPFGIMVLAAVGEPAAIDQAVAWIRQQQLDIEEYPHELDADRPAA